MRPVLTVHIAAGRLALVAGFIALFVAKGGRLHRTSGLVFVGAMVVMGSTGAAIAAMLGENGNVLGGMLAAYLVVTAVTTVRAVPGSRWVDLTAMTVALAFGLIGVTTGLDILARGEFTEAGVPAPMYLFMGTVALAAAVSDVRVIRFGSLSGRPRLIRHLWRMCFALWVAAGSFFLGQAGEFPESLRIWPLLSIPVVLPLLAISTDVGSSAARVSSASVGTRETPSAIREEVIPARPKINGGSQKVDHRRRIVLNGRYAVHLKFFLGAESAPPQQPLLRCCSFWLHHGQSQLSGQELP